MNFKARLISGDIYRKRPDMNIEPGIFLKNLPDYSMIIGGKSKNGTMNDNTMSIWFNFLLFILSNFYKLQHMII